MASAKTTTESKPESRSAYTPVHSPLRSKGVSEMNIRCENERGQDCYRVVCNAPNAQTCLACERVLCHACAVDYPCLVTGRGHVFSVATTRIPNVERYLVEQFESAVRVRDLEAAVNYYNSWTVFCQAQGGCADAAILAMLGKTANFGVSV